jgi:hypothetical protein
VSARAAATVAVLALAALVARPFDFEEPHAWKR